MRTVRGDGTKLDVNGAQEVDPRKRSSAILCGAILLALAGVPAALADTGPGNDPSIAAYTERVPSPTGSKPVAQARTRVVPATRPATPAPRVTPTVAPKPKAQPKPAPEVKPKPRRTQRVKQAPVKVAAAPKASSVVSATGSGLGDVGRLLVGGGIAIALAVGLLAWRARRTS